MNLYESFTFSPFLFVLFCSPAYHSRLIISPRLKQPSSWTGWDWSPSPWCGCLSYTEWLLQKLPSTRPSVTSARSAQSLDSGIWNMAHLFMTPSLMSCASACLLLLQEEFVPLASSQDGDEAGTLIASVSFGSLGYFVGPDPFSRCPFPFSLCSSKIHIFGGVGLSTDLHRDTCVSRASRWVVPPLS